MNRFQKYKNQFFSINNNQKWKELQISYQQQDPYSQEVECYLSPSFIQQMVDKEDQYLIDFKSERICLWRRNAFFYSSQLSIEQYHDDIQSPIVAVVRLQPKTVASHTGTKAFKQWILLLECFINQLNNIYQKFMIN
ncbi:unnamed protein product [Paramecium sonneborni]|uniref:Uncharacterized protein n=1 Tax=Paramecium sonneborni TaxID=65129 RepID=A0A8S1RM18_9CILI|nr:unnamed protein product [Paramecium sonneborni]